MSNKELRERLTPEQYHVTQEDGTEPELSRRFADHSHGVDPAPMTFDSGQTACLGPAAISIHDDSNVGGQFFEFWFFGI